jgi:hypothetical protein
MNAAKQVWHRLAGSGWVHPRPHFSTLFRGRKLLDFYSSTLPAATRRAMSLAQSACHGLMAGRRVHPQPRFLTIFEPGEFLDCGCESESATAVQPTVAAATEAPRAQHDSSPPREKDQSLRKTGTAPMPQLGLDVSPQEGRELAPPLQDQAESSWDDICKKLVSYLSATSTAGPNQPDGGEHSKTAESAIAGRQSMRR